MTGLFGLRSSSSGAIYGAAEAMRNEQSSDRLASLASRAIRDPGSLTHDEIRSLGGSVLTQAPDRN
jgi:hypothetical protein